MLQPADILLLDEPTNDLDIPTLEILEESLLEFRGALILVTHDRCMMDRVSTVILGLDGLGEAKTFADYSQWDEWQRLQSAKAPPKAASEPPPPREALMKKKLSYMEARELAAIEERIALAEQELRAKRAALEDPSIVSDAPRLVEVYSEIEAAEKSLDDLYVRWSELEQKQTL
jgi:ATP-binding cassette subfamily F protein uup